MTAPNFVGSVVGLFGSLLHDIFTAVVSNVISGSVSALTSPVILPPPRSRFVETVRNFFYEEPLTEETWRDSIVLAIIMISITYGARYITYIQNRRLLGRVIPDQPGPPPFSGVEITARDGRIVLSITPLALYMGCTIVIIAVILTIWRSRRSSTGSHDNPNGSPKDSRR